ncbi:hypothetical protein N7495_007335 [Penicillium taxi]|uniref:uncharacterized protein n=1 Tax=Penicillium taxi TaxID=168475 RepID=UPI0025459857|nr:uncharacterized protein N7495_007335 [Penicillium taxi]KAJ5895644.1 hypothetical protein N7495_007335 [Penicillium taxi]
MSGTSKAPSPSPARTSLVLVVVVSFPTPDFMRVAAPTPVRQWPAAEWGQGYIDAVMIERTRNEVPGMPVLLTLSHLYR